MANLKAGRVNDFSNSMAEAIETAMKQEWHAVKGEWLPAPLGEEDRRILFVAVARGVLGYLKAHQADILTNTEHDTTSGHHHQLSFDFD